MHRHLCERRFAILVQDSTDLIDNYAELYYPPTSNQWTQPDTYVRSSDTVEEAISSGLVDS